MAGAPPATAADVKRANRRLYDAVADRYEALDGRRDATLVTWIRSTLRELASVHGSGVLLDLGSGSGIVTRAAESIFKRTIALDLSPNILAAAGSIADHRIAADTDALPLADATADVVTCFAVLHHLYDGGRLAREVTRVLKPGGVFWSDHDMDLAFYRRFRWPLTGYRRLRGADRKYAKAAADNIDERDYALAEYRENGVDAARFVDELGAAGLEPRATFHWFGLMPLTNRLFGRRPRSRGWAPIMSVRATRPEAHDADSATRKTEWPALS